MQSSRIGAGLVFLANLRILRWVALFWSIGLATPPGQDGGIVLAASYEPATEAQRQRSRQSRLPPQAGAWLLELDLWGGHAGFTSMRGARVTSEGKVEITRVSEVICRAQLLKADLRDIELAVSSARPSGWNEHYSKGEYDPFNWNLRFHRREKDNSEQTYRTYGDFGAVLPGDLEAVRTATLKILSDVEKRCENRGTLRD